VRVIVVHIILRRYCPIDEAEADNTPRERFELYVQLGMSWANTPSTELNDPGHAVGDVSPRCGAARGGIDGQMDARRFCPGVCGTALPPAGDWHWLARLVMFVNQHGERSLASFCFPVAAACVATREISA